jgi:apolipoprotein N-acyltransferase
MPQIHAAAFAAAMSPNPRKRQKPASAAVAETAARANPVSRPGGVYNMYLLFIAGGFMLFVASPPFGFGMIAFVSLIPFLHAVRLAPSYSAAAVGGLLAGSALFFPGVHWISNVSYAAWLSLAPYCATYLIVFAVFAYSVRRLHPISHAAVLAASWI